MKNKQLKILILLGLLITITCFVPITIQPIHASGSTFGKTDIGESSGEQLFWEKVGCPYQTSEDGELTSISVYITDVLYATEIKVALYTVTDEGDYPNEPRDLLAESYAQGIVSGWNTIPITFSLVELTWYYLTFLTDGESEFAYEEDWIHYFFSATNEWNGFTDPYWYLDWDEMWGGFLSIYGTYSAPFGHTEAEETFVSISDAIFGGYATCPETGQAQSITVYLNLWTAGFDTVKCAIYKASDKSFIAETEESDAGGPVGWYSFNFTDYKPPLFNEEYILVTWADGLVQGAYGASAGDKILFNHAKVYDSFPDPIVGTDSEDYVWSIYCSYIPGEPEYGVEYDYVDNDISDVDSSADIGTHSNFTTQKYYDSTYDNLTESDTQAKSNNVEDFVDNNTSDKDGSPDKGTHSNFPAQQAHDSIVDTLTEAETTTGDGSEWLGCDAFSGDVQDWDDSQGSGNYLSTIDDGNVLQETSADGVFAYWFSFPDTTLLGTITANISVYAKNDDGAGKGSGEDHANVIVDYIGGDGSELGGAGDNIEYAYYTFSIGDLTVAQANAIRLKLEYNKVGAGDDVYVDYARVGFSSDGVTNYELDLEIQWTSVDFDKTDEYLCIYTKTQTGAEGLYVDVWNVDSWTRIIDFLGVNVWTNVSISSYLNSSELTIRFLGRDESGDTNQGMWRIDCSLIHTYTVNVQYELDLEIQWTNANYTRNREELCISTGAFYGSEVIMVNVWHSSSWKWVMNLSASTFNNVSVASYLDASTFTVQFKGGNEVLDAIQDGWLIDCALLHTWIVEEEEWIDCNWIGTNNTIAGEPALLSSDWTDLNASSGLSHSRFSTNNTGTWVEDAWTDTWYSQNWTRTVKILNTTLVTVAFRWRVNDTLGVEYDSTICFFVTTGLAGVEPIARFTFDPSNPTEINSEVQFNASESVDYDGSITGYYWDFGDGVPTSEESADIEPIVQSTVDLSFVHGYTYYNGYVYGCQNGFNGDDGEVVKININNYLDKTIVAVMRGAIQAGSLYDLIEAFGYIWTVDSDRYLYKLNPSNLYTVDYSYPGYGTGIMQALCADDTHIYVSATEGRVSKYNIITKVWGNNAFYPSGTLHAIAEDGDYLYISDTTNEWIRKVFKSNLTQQSYVSVGYTVPDDIAQDDDYIYGGIEETTGGIVRVTKSNMSVYSVTPTGHGKSYGCFKVDDKILNLDASNNKIWIFLSSLEVLRVVTLANLTYGEGINELAFDNYFLHLTQWRDNITPIIKLYKFEVLGWHSGMEINYTYTEAGEYTVALIVTDNDGLIDTFNQTIVVSAISAPIARFTYSPSNPQPQETITFNATESISYDGIVSYFWNFGDGANTTGETATHSYSSAGSYPVNLTVTDNQGLNDTITHIITVEAPPPLPPPPPPPVYYAPAKQYDLTVLVKDQYRYPLESVDVEIYLNSRLILSGKTDEYGAFIAKRQTGTKTYLVKVTYEDRTQETTVLLDRDKTVTFEYALITFDIVFTMFERNWLLVVLVVVVAGMLTLRWERIWAMLLVLACLPIIFYADYMMFPLQFKLFFTIITMGVGALLTKARIYT